MRFIAMAAAVLVAAAATAAHAQAPTPAAPAPVPEAMPFDVPYGAPVNLDTAKAVMAAAVEAKKHNWKLAITFVDPSGNIGAHATMDGTQYGSIEIAQAKARTARCFAGRRSCSRQPSTPTAPRRRSACWH